MPVDTDPGPPEERTLDSVILSGRSESTQVNEWRVQRFVGGDTYWSINKSSGLEKTHRLRFPRALHQERSIPQPFNAFEGSGHRLETLLDSKGRQFTQWEVVTWRLLDQKPWPIVTGVVGAFVIRVRVRILVVVP